MLFLSNFTLQNKLIIIRIMQIQIYLHYRNSQSLYFKWFLVFHQILQRKHLRNSSFGSLKIELKKEGFLITDFVAHDLILISFETVKVKGGKS